MAAELYRPPVARFIVLGEAPPPTRYFYYGDSLFFRAQRLAFAAVLPEVLERDAGWFLAFFRAIGGWRIDVCETPQRATKGGAEDVTDCLQAFGRRWARQPRAENALLIVSPKRLVPRLPEPIQNVVDLAVAPPGQWNAHRESFHRDMTAALTREYGARELRAIAATIDADDARLDFEIAVACASPQDGDEELKRLVRGHPRETELWTAYRSAEEEP